MAEPEAGVDFVGTLRFSAGVRRLADDSVRAKLDSSGRSVLEGLPEERYRGMVPTRSSNRYTLLEGMTAKGQGLFLKGDQVETVTDPDGRQGWRLTEAGAKLGMVRLQWVTTTFNDRGLHRALGSLVYADLEAWDFYRVPVYTALAFFVLLLFVAVPKDRARKMVWKHGRRLRGPELVTTTELNEKLGRSKGMETYLPDGASFINEEQTWTDKIFHKEWSRWA